MDAIKEEIENRSSEIKGQISSEICNIIKNSRSFEPKYYKVRYEYNKNIDFLYRNDLQPQISKIMHDSEMITNSIPNPRIPTISKLFYDGFGFEI